MEREKRIRKETIMFFFVLFGITAFILMVFFVSENQHKLYDTPEIENGVLDLSGWDRHHVIALDGNWQFYWNRWIISDVNEDVKGIEPDSCVKVPEHWSNYVIDGEKLPKKGRASYRIVLQNCPENVELITYVPNFRTSYKAYLNGQLVASSGDMSVALEVRHGAYVKELNRAYHARNNWFGSSGEKEMELVIEVDRGMIDGLVLTPILAENQNEYFVSSMRYIVVSVYFGMMLLSMFVFGYILFRNYRSVQSVILFFLSLLMFIRILMKDEFFGIIEVFLPAHAYLDVYLCLKFLTILIPLMYWIYIRNLVDLSIGKTQETIIFAYEAVCLAIIFIFMIRGMPKLEYLMTCISLLPFLLVLWMCYRGIRRGEKGIFHVSLCIMFLLGSIITGSLYTSGFLMINISMVPPTFFVFYVLVQDYIFIRKISDVHRDELEAAKLRLMLQETERNLMLSQIRPHFLYNALVAIQVLCRQDPEKAETAVFDFAQYLRANMSFMTSQEPIPFEKELDHIRHYAAIEKLRFQERLTVIYNINVIDFDVPPLTIQPLVENAIKHGASKKIHGGWVKLETYETENEYQIYVIDNGPGFDVATLDKKQKEGSCGIHNITLRLKEMMNAEISFRTETGCGTVVLVKIPRTEGGTEDESNHSG